MLAFTTGAAALPGPCRWSDDVSWVSMAPWTP
jgi:hypothetical protein